MKIVFLHPPLYPTNFDYFESLSKFADVKVLVFGKIAIENPTWNTQDLYDSGYEKDGVRLQYNFKLSIVNTKHYAYHRYSLRFIPKLLRERPDIVISIAFAPFTLYATLLSKLFNYRLLVKTDATLSSDKPYHYNILHHLNRMIILSLASGVIGASSSTSEYIQALSKKTKIVQIPQTVNITRIKEESENWIRQKEKIRAEINIPDNATLMVGVGRFIALKQWDKGLHLLQMDHNLHYLLVGKGELRDFYRRAAQDLAVDARFHIHDFVEEKILIKLLSCADFFYFPTAKDTYGFVVLEALASGLPVICSTGAGVHSMINDIRDFASEKTNGLLVAPDEIPSVELLSKFITKIPGMKRHIYESILALDLDLTNQQLLIELKKLL